MVVTGINGNHKVTSYCVKLELKGDNNQVWTTKIATHPNVPIHFQAPDFSSQDIAFLKKQGIEASAIMNLKRHNGQTIDLLLGNNFIAKISTISKRYELPSSRMLEKTPLVPNNSTLETTDYFAPAIINALETKECEDLQDEELVRRVEQLFELEHVGIRPAEQCEEERTSDETLIEKTKEEAAVIDGRIHVSFPFNGRELKRYLMIADIEKAFHQVRIKPEFRDLTRFLWLKDPNKPATPDNIEIYRFTRLPFGMSCSPFLLAVTILMYLDINPHEINTRILQNLYVDNTVFTTNDEQELEQLYKDSKEAFNKMGMNLREYQVNSSKIHDKILETDRAQNTECKLLGHVWDSVADTLTIKIAKPPTEAPTKRKVVSFLASTYDPLGLLSPIIVPIKEFVQTLWEEPTAWKQLILKASCKRWYELIASFTRTTFTIPRQLTEYYNYKSVKIMMFSDASELHFATAAYLHYEIEDRPPVTKIIFAKPKVKPRKSKLTIPRLELLGIQLAVNTATMLVREIDETKLTEVKFFSDSTIALYWILKRSKVVRFVDNRNSTQQTWLREEPQSSCY
ncbi:unnamed protein product [Caenorhabditis sp. 36 PRJEB53466]|nr:unnamed protein product [Caenorhabditis sp. 36 PRJEB53466]